MSHKQALEEFQNVAKSTSGQSGSSYKSSNGYEFIIWIENGDDHPEPESDLIEWEVDFDDDTFEDYYKFAMTLPFEPTDLELVDEWLQQDAPKPEELTEDDVLFAYLAEEVLTKYRQNSKWSKFSLDRCDGLSMHSVGTGWEQALEDVKRGIAVLNGYVLWANPRTAIFYQPRSHDESVQDKVFGAGYLAMTEQHRIYSLLPANDLITLGEAAMILYGENTQSKRVMLKQDILYGDFQMFTDKEENNPQKNQRLSRREVVMAKAKCITL